MQGVRLSDYLLGRVACCLTTPGKAEGCLTAPGSISYGNQKWSRNCAIPRPYLHPVQKKVGKIFALDKVDAIFPIESFQNKKYRNCVLTEKTADHR